MTKKILVSYDFSKLEAINFRFQNLSSAMGSPVAGMAYYDTTDGVWRYRNASAWIDPLDRQFHSGTQLASTISNFDTAVRTSRLDQMAAPTTDVSANSRKITNLADGVSAGDAVNLSQLQQVANGRSFKDSVRAATTANIALSGTQTIDGVAVVAADRVLVKNQSSGAQNGIYVVAAGSWSRATDADATAELRAGTTVSVEEGTTNGDKQFSLTTDGTIVVGTTALTFAQTGSGTTYTGSGGVNVSGSVISADTAVVVTKYAATIGDNSSTSIAVTHSLGTKDVIVSVRQVSDDAHVDCDIVSTSTSQITLGFAVAPATNSLRVVVHG